MVADDFKVTGAADLLKLGHRLKAEQGVSVLKELTKALQKGAKPIVPATRQEALRRLPKRGGLAARVAKAPQRVTARIGSTSASVRITVGGKKSGAYGANIGTVRHPVFGRKRYVNQSVRPGWHTDTAEKEAPKARADVVDVMERFADRLTRPL